MINLGSNIDVIVLDLWSISSVRSNWYWYFMKQTLKNKDYSLITPNSYSSTVSLINI